MNDLGRRYYLFMSTPKNRQKVLGAAIAAAAILNLIGSTYGQSHAHSRTVAVLFGISFLLLGAAVVLMFTYRKAR
jgi:hypothetical protein